MSSNDSDGQFNFRRGPGTYLASSHTNDCKNKKAFVGETDGEGVERFWHTNTCKSRDGVIRTATLQFNIVVAERRTLHKLGLCVPNPDVSRRNHSSPCEQQHRRSRLGRRDPGLIDWEEDFSVYESTPVAVPRSRGADAAFSFSLSYDVCCAWRPPTIQYIFRQVNLGIIVSAFKIGGSKSKPSAQGSRTHDQALSAE
ncbi:hypothetical protein DFH06DRAFT_1149861 [Mycena polygramma]|nr:hypothetical protein DFH06DRAFT_1149861 [Mycena polygramma]